MGVCSSFTLFTPNWRQPRRPHQVGDKHTVSIQTLDTLLPEKEMSDRARETRRNL